MELVAQANKYIKENKDRVKHIYRNIFHMQPSIGWMNDPNGLIFVDNEFHLYYQSNPFHTFPRNVGWGHYISKDLISYRDVGMAICPESDKNETGCFSGSAYIENGKVYFVYTRHYDDVINNTIHESQYICESNDLNEFTKEENPCVDINELPIEIKKTDFRDPQIFYRNNKCYLLIGGHTVDDKGVFIIYSGLDSHNLHYDFYFGPYANTHCMVECPCIKEIDGYDVIIFSSYGLNTYVNGHSVNNKTYYMVGKFEPENKTFNVLNSSSIDSGDTFYAPKLFENTKEAIMVAWMDKWEQEHVTHILHHHWVGSFTIPRILSLDNLNLKQKIIPTLFDYCTNKYEVKNNSNIKKHSYNKFSFKNNFDLKIVSTNGELHLFAYNGSIMFDTTKSNNLDEMVFKSKFEYEQGEIEILLDTSSVEIFINDGAETITSRYYFLDDEFEVHYSGLTNMISQEIEVKQNEEK